MSRQFLGHHKGPSFFYYEAILSFITLFEFFWIILIIDAIVEEINRYSKILIDIHENTLE